MIKLYLFRHGESEWNKNKNAIYSEENHNSNLTELGIAQAKKTANFLKDKNIECIYSSNLKRAFQTAQELSKLINIDIKIDENLREFSMYDETCYGLTRLEIIEKIGKEIYESIRYSKNGSMDWRPFNAETKREARMRIVNSINNICRNTKNKIIAIATHGAILTELIFNYDFDLKYPFMFPINNCDILEINYEKGSFDFIKKIDNSEL